MRFVPFVLLILLTTCSTAPGTVQVGAPFAWLGEGEDTYFRSGLKEACDYTDVVLGSDAYEREVALCERWVQMHRKDQLRYDYSKFAEALHTGNCQFAAKKLLGAFRALMDDAVFNAGRLRKGLCVEADLDKARGILEQALKDTPGDPLVLAHLGDMLWKGEGAPQDQPRARALFERAANAALPHYIDATFQALHREPRYPYEDWVGVPVQAGFWGYLKVHLAANFAHPILGPWILPEPLYEARLRMEDILYAEGHALVEKVNALLLSPSQADQSAAIEMLEAGTYSRKYPASLKIANILRTNGSKDFPAALGFYAKDPQCQAVFFFEEAALDGSYDALLFFLDAAQTKAETSLPPGVYQKVMTDTAINRYALYEIAGAERRRLLSSMHSLVAEVLAYGYPIPPSFAPMANRLLMEAVDSRRFPIVLPGVDVWSFVTRTC